MPSAASTSRITGTCGTRPAGTSSPPPGGPGQRPGCRSGSAAVPARSPFRLGPAGLASAPAAVPARSRAGWVAVQARRPSRLGCALTCLPPPRLGGSTTTLPAMTSPFAPEALTERLTRAAKAAAERGMDALFVTPGPDLRYLTGYDAVPLERLTCLAIPASGEPVLGVPLLERPAARTSPVGAPWLDV